MECFCAEFNQKLEKRAQRAGHERSLCATAWTLLGQHRRTSGAGPGGGPFPSACIAAVLLTGLRLPKPSTAQPGHVSEMLVSQA